MNKWISIKDEMPPQKEKVLLYTDCGIFEGYCQKESWVEEYFEEEPRIITTKKGTTYTRKQSVKKERKEEDIIFHTDCYPYESCCYPDECFIVSHWTELPESPQNE